MTSMNILTIVNLVNLKAVKKESYKYAIGTLIDIFTILSEWFLQMFLAELRCGITHHVYE